MIIRDSGVHKIGLRLARFQCLLVIFRDSLDTGEDDPNETPTVQQEVLPH
jgi:hypothetical protein